MATTTLRISSTRISGPFVAKVEQISSQNLMACYQCGKCSAGCPMAAHMDILPNQIIRMAQLGMHERLLASEAIWTCVSCMTCNTRCPKNVRIAETIESLRAIVLRTTDRKDALNVGALSATARADLPPIAMIAALRKLAS